MTEYKLSQAQQDMRTGYFWGAPGVAVSGLVWLVAGFVALLHSPSRAVLVLLVGGALIHPAGVVLNKLLGRSGAHTAGNPLGVLAMEGTVWLIAGIAIAYAMQILRPEWFFPAMLLVIGGRYLTFQTVYGLRIYWLLGATLCATGLALMLTPTPAATSALAGAAIELGFAVVIFILAKRRQEN